MRRRELLIRAQGNSDSYNYNKVFKTQCIVRACCLMITQNNYSQEYNIVSLLIIRISFKNKHYFMTFDKVYSLPYAIEQHDAS